ncbi:MAG: methyl-accepting chemotaxis protein [Chitinophagales bacterium]
MRLRQRLPLTMVLLVVLPLLVSGAVLYLKSSAWARQETLATIESRAGDLAALIGAKMEDLAHRAAFVAARPESVRLLARDAAPAIPSSPTSDAGRFVRLMLREAGAESVFLVDRTGRCVASTDPAVVGKSLGNRPYIQEALTGRPAHSDVMVSAGTGHQVVARASPVVKDGEVLGAAGLAIEVGRSVLGFLKDVRLGQVGYAVLLDGQAKAIVHPDPKEIGRETPVPELQQAAKGAEASGGVLYRFKGVAKYAGFAKVPGSAWTVITQRPLAEVESAARAMLGLILAVSLACALVAGAVGLAASRGVVGPLDRVRKVAEALARGDLTQTTGVSTTDELGAMARAVDAAVGNLRGLVGRVRETAEQVAASAEELSSSSQAVGQTTQQVAETISQLAKGSDEQAKQAQETSTAVEEMASAIGQADAAAQKVAGDAAQAATSALAGQEAVRQSVRQMEAINQAAGATAAAIGRLGERSRQIGRIVEVITGIADQTNLLALNAAIEAARAGEQGRGFAVVAEEVRKLAEQSREAAEQISGLVREIQTDTTQAVATMDAGGREVAAGSEVVAQAGAAFAEIARVVRTVVDQVEQVSLATRQLATSSEQVVKSVESIAAITEQAAAGAEEISASSEEQTASVQEIASSAQSLSALAQDLEKAVAAFNF